MMWPMRITLALVLAVLTVGALSTPPADASETTTRPCVSEGEYDHLFERIGFGYELSRDDVRDVTGMRGTRTHEVDGWTAEDFREYKVYRYRLCGVARTDAMLYMAYSRDLSTAYLPMLWVRPGVEVWA